MPPARSTGRRGCASPTTSTPCTRCSGAVRRDAPTTVGSRSAGSTSATCWRSTTRRRTCSTRRTFANGRKAFRDAFKDYDVFYAGKAFLCTTVARWVQEEGLNLDVCSSGRADGRAEGRASTRAGSATTATTRRTPSCGARCTRASGGSSWTRSTRSSGWRRSSAARGQEPERDDPGDRRRRGAHARVHRHRARGPEVRVLDHQRRRVAGGAAWSQAADGLNLLGLHSHIGSQIFDSSGFEVAARRVLALQARISEELGVTLPEIDLGGGFGIAYTTQDDPSRPRAARDRDDQDRRARVPRAGHPRTTTEHRARPRDRRPVGLHRLHRRHRQAGRAGRRRGAHVRQRRRRDERQHPDGAVRRRLLVHRRLPRQRGAARARARGRQALRGRRHRGDGRVPARRRESGRPDRGARHGRLLSVDGLQLQPRAAAAGHRRARRRGHRAAAPRDRG